jgi:hypothetical protein
MHADFDAPSFFIGISQSELSVWTAKFTGPPSPWSFGSFTVMKMSC